VILVETELGVGLYAALFENALGGGRQLVGDENAGGHDFVS
jgi:hypothetical protein